MADGSDSQSDTSDREYYPGTNLISWDTPLPRDTCASHIVWNVRGSFQRETGDFEQQGHYVITVTRHTSKANAICLNYLAGMNIKGNNNIS